MRSLRTGVICVLILSVAPSLVCSADVRQPARSIKVIVVDADDLKPLPTARVEIALATQSTAKTKVANTAGEVEFPDIPSIGTAVINVSFPAYRSESLELDLDRSANNADVVVKMYQITLVSLLGAITNPERYDGRPIRTMGFLAVEAEGDALYFHETDYRQRITKNAIWLDISPEQLSQFSRLSGRYVSVVGTVVADRKGHMNLFSATLSRLQDVRSWPP